MLDRDVLMRILHDYEFLGLVELDGVDYILVTSSDPAGKFEYLSVFEVETSLNIDEYSFSIVDAALIKDILREFGRKYTQEELCGN